MPINAIRPPVASGLPASVDLLTDELAQRLARAHDVIVYCARGHDQQSIERVNGVEYRRMSTWLDRRLLNSRKFNRLMDFVGGRQAPQPIISSWWWFRHFISEVVSDLSRDDCDIVHIINIPQFVPVIRARLPKARIVLHMHCQWLEHLDAAVIEPRIRAADLILGCSDFIAAGVRQRFPSLAQRCRRIYNGTDIAAFAKPTGIQRKPTQLLFVGRLAPEKGVHILLEAFQIVLQEYPDAHLELIGPDWVIPREALLGSCDDPYVLELEPYFRPGVYAKLLRAKVAEFPSNSIAFLNNGMAYCELAPHYHSASIFVWPSVWKEPFGLPLVEAMMSHLPVVATRDGASPEIVEAGRSGLLVEPADVQGLANAILRLLSNRDEREAMARAAFERACAVFSWDQIGAEFLHTYERLVD